MKILVLNGSPRKNGNVSNLLKKESDRLLKKNPGAEIIWENVSDLNFSFCHGCMACRSKGSCLLPEDDAHKIENEIKECDMLMVGTPVYWANMNGKLKSLFDRLVGVLMGESKHGIPLPLHKGKRAVIVTSCTTPFPFNYFCGQSSGAVRAVREVLKSSGFKVIKKINLSNTKTR
nr:flavodoxin family protein [uncultured Treponema sp.]